MTQWGFLKSTLPTQLLKLSGQSASLRTWFDRFNIPPESPTLYIQNVPKYHSIWPIQAVFRTLCPRNFESCVGKVLVLHYQKQRGLHCKKVFGAGSPSEVIYFAGELNRRSCLGQESWTWEIVFFDSPANSTYMTTSNMVRTLNHPLLHFLGDLTPTNRSHITSRVS